MGLLIMEYFIVALLVVILIEQSRKLKNISDVAADLQIRLFHIEKLLIDSKDQIESISKPVDHD